MEVEMIDYMKNDSIRKVPLKNYIILSVVIIVTLLILYYFYMWVDVYKESKINIPIMDKYMEVINYNELDNYLVENPDTVVYVSILEDDEIREFEKKFKNKYKYNKIHNEILYLNITDDINDKNIKSEMENKYLLNNLNMTDVPCIIVFKNGIVKSIYSVSDNDYDIDMLVSYLNNLMLESDDM